MGLLYTSIRVKDVKKSLSFYTKNFGMKETDRKSYMPGETVITLISPDTKQQLRLMHYTKSCKLYSPWKEDGVELDHLTFKVKDAKKMYGRLLKAGCEKATDLWEGEQVTMGYIKDPNGIWIGLITMKKKK